jgi:hypothetical protein
MARSASFHSQKGRGHDDFSAAFCPGRLPYMGARAFLVLLQARVRHTMMRVSVRTAILGAFTTPSHNRTDGGANLALPRGRRRPTFRSVSMRYDRTQRTEALLVFLPFLPISAPSTGPTGPPTCAPTSKPSVVPTIHARGRHLAPSGAGPMPSGAPATPPANAGGTVGNYEVTYYGWIDNSPPGCAKHAALHRQQQQLLHLGPESTIPPSDNTPNPKGT